MQPQHLTIQELFHSKKLKASMSMLMALTLTATTVLIPGCSSKSPTESDPPGISPLTVSPPSAPPAALIELTGIKIQQNALDSHYVLIDGEFAPLFVDSAGNVFATVPGFIDTIALWPAPPAGPVGVAIMHKRDTVAYGASILTVTPLLEAPGTLVQYVDDMRAVSSSLLAITESLFADSTEASMLLFGYTKALDTFLVADEASLLQTTLAEVQADATALKIVDALIAASGMAASMRSLAEGLDGVAASLVRAKSLAGPAQSTSFNPTDISLAAAMQASVLLHQAGGFIGSSQTGVGSTAFGGLSLFSSFTGLLRMSPVIGLAVSAVALGTALQGLMIQKFIVGAMPSKIKELKLEFAEDTILTGENTDATFHIVATNKPDPLTVNDLVGVIMSVLGTWASTVSTYTNLSDGLKQFLRTNLDDVQRALDDAVLWILNNTRTQLNQYLGSNPNVVYDPGILDLGNPVPLYTWEADIETPFLLELRTLHQNKIVPITDELNWEALYDEFGDATVYAVPSREPEALAFTDPRLANFFGEFGAGAFGTDQTGTGNVGVVIQPELDVQVNMSPTIDTIGFEPVTITAGYVDATGQTVPTRDITLTLTAGGGTVLVANGTTNSSGEFSTQAQLGAGSPQITVTAKAKGAVNSEDEASSTANKLDAIPEIIVETQEALNAFSGVTVAKRVVLSKPGSLLVSNINSLAPLANLRELTGEQGASGGSSLHITGSSLSSLVPLSNLTIVHGGIRIQDNPNLGSMVGLNNIDDFNGDIHIWDNPINSLAPLGKIKACNGFTVGLMPNLTSLSGLTSMDSVIMNFSISDGAPHLPRTAVTDLTGFPNLSYLGGLIIVNSDIRSLNGFPSTITEFGTDDVFNFGRYLRIQSSRKLTSLAGLSNLVTVNGQVEIIGVDSLASLNGLASLAIVRGDLEVRAAPLIDSLDAEAWAAGITVSGRIEIDP